MQDHGEIDILEMIDGDGFAHATYHWENVTRCAQPYGHLSQTTQRAMPPNWGAAPHEYAVEFTVRGWRHPPPRLLCFTSHALPLPR